VSCSWTPRHLVRWTSWMSRRQRC